jgi:hypothetical protein
MWKSFVVPGALIAVVFVSLTATISRPRASESPVVTVPSDVTDAVDSLASTSTYFTIRRDVRRCASPMCGGYFVRRVNRTLTLCADGRYATDCYVAEIDWNGQGGVEPNRALIRGDIVGNVHPRFGRLGRFRVRESWEAGGTNTPSGEYFRVRDLGIRCITHPCLTHHEARLNSMVSRRVAGVDLNNAGANDAAIQQAFTAMTSQEGILVSGSHRAVAGPGGRAQALRASQFYLRARASGGSAKPCMKTGCSGQVCSDEEVVTTCEYRSEYDCYKRARCERQANGECGFTQTRELTTCLNRRQP